MGLSALGVMEAVLENAREACRLHKAAADPTEPTTHPVMDITDGTQKAQTGARAAEHKKDITEAFGEAGVSGQEDSSAAGDGKVPANSVGTQAMFADEVKGNVPTPKATKDAPAKGGAGDASPGHPTNETFQEKYSSARMAKRGHEILADLVVTLKRAEDASELPEKKKEEGKNKAVPFLEGKEDKKVGGDEKKEAAARYREDAEQGYIAAQLLAEAVMGKSAEDQKIAKVIAGVVKAAGADADLVVDFIQGFEKGAAISRTVKAAEMPIGAEGGIPQELLAGAAGGIPQELLAGAAGAPQEGIPGAEGGAPTEEDPEKVLDALADALAEAGVTPEELAQIVAEQGAGAGAGEGKAPEEGASSAEEIPAEQNEELKEKEKTAALRVKIARIVGGK